MSLPKKCPISAPQWSLFTTGNCGYGCINEQFGSTEGTCHRYLLEVCGRLNSDKLLSLLPCSNALLLLQLTSQASPVQRESRAGPAVPFLVETRAQQAAKRWGLPEKHPADLPKERTNADTPYVQIKETYPIRISLWQSQAINNFPSHIIAAIKNTSSQFNKWKQDKRPHHPVFSQLYDSGCSNVLPSVFWK